MTLMVRMIKWSLKEAEIIQQIIQSQEHITSYLWPGGVHTRTCTYICMEVISRNYAGMRFAATGWRTWFKNYWPQKQIRYVLELQNVLSAQKQLLYVI